jgi:cell division protein FtsB
VRQPVGRAQLTARAAILAVALASVALALALPFKVWLGQRAQVHQLEAQTRSQQQQVDKLRAQQQRWQDPAYVEQQARVRLHYARPGETTYVVLGRPHAKRAKTAHKSPTTTLHGPWYSQLWQSDEAAGRS